LSSKSLSLRSSSLILEFILYSLSIILQYKTLSFDIPIFLFEYLSNSEWCPSLGIYVGRDMILTSKL
jgi:hypothetical protein